MGRCLDGWVTAGRWPIRRFTVLLVLVALSVLATGCAATTDVVTEATDENTDENTDADAAGVTTDDTVAQSTTIDPIEARNKAQARSVVVTTSSCGATSKAIGSGVAISPTRILTVAHVVAGATDVEVIPAATYAAERAPERDTASEPTGAAFRATIVAFDSLRDLAVLEIDPDSWSGPTPPETFPSASPLFDVLAAEDPGTIIGGVTSGDVAFTVTEKTIIEMDEVRGTRRSRRSGYLIDAETDRGDSGAGLYADSGQLVGLLFAVSTGNNRRSWATAADELEDFLADTAVTGSFGCNPDESEVERTP